MQFNFSFINSALPRGDALRRQGSVRHHQEWWAVQEDCEQPEAEGALSGIQIHTHPRGTCHRTYRRTHTCKLSLSRALIDTHAEFVYRNSRTHAHIRTCTNTSHTCTHTHVPVHTSHSCVDTRFALRRWETSVKTDDTLEDYNNCFDVLSA